MKFSPINQGCLSYFMQVIKDRLMIMLIQSFTLVPLLRPLWDGGVESSEPRTAVFIKAGRSRGQGVQCNKSSKGGNIGAVSCSLTHSNKLPCHASRAHLSQAVCPFCLHILGNLPAPLSNRSLGMMEWACRVYQNCTQNRIANSPPIPSHIISSS